MKKLLTLFLAIVTVISSVAFVSCSDKEESKMLSIVANGESKYAIYRGEKAANGEKEGGAELRSLINDVTGVRLQYTTDDEYGKIEGALEILVGDTNRDESKIPLEGLGENQFRMMVIGDKIVINASNKDCLTAAAQKFVEEYADENGVSVPANLDRTWQCKEGYTYREVSNPIYEPSGADPYVIEREGVYYHCWAGGGGVKVSKAESIDKVTRDTGSLVWKAPGGTMYSKDIWAPELHYIQGNWYIYVAADDGENANHRMYVLKGTTQDPTDKFEFVGKITDPTDMWAIDGTVLQYKDELYFIWSGWPHANAGNHQNLYIAHMSDPCTIDSERVLISSPQYDWEKPLCEGPIPLIYNDQVFILYSGAGSWTADYCIAYLKLTGNDPMKAKNWEKSKSPILSQRPGAKGPGHCSIAPAEDGTPWVIYHANLNEAGWDDRSIWAQPLEFDKNGNPKIMKVESKVELPEAAWFADVEIE